MKGYIIEIFMRTAWSKHYMSSFILIIRIPFVFNITLDILIEVGNRQPGLKILYHPF